MSNPWIRRFFLFLALGVVLGWMGPFGTYVQLPGWRRLAYWMIAVPGVGMCARIAMMMVAGHGRTGAWPLLARIAAGSALAGFPGTFIALLLQGGMTGELDFPMLGLIQMYATVSLVIGLIAYPLILLTGSRPAPEIETPVAAESPFLRRIPAKLGTDLLWLSAEDHYIRVTTPLGSDLILCRLSDAIAELGAAAGQRVHRSHWVAQGAVKSVERRDGKTVLLLVNGDNVPVSQSYAPVLKAAGWL